MLSMIEQVFNKNGQVRIIDIGGTRDYWRIVPDETLRKHRTHVTVVNLPGATQPTDDDFFSFVEGDACDLQGFKNKSFDIAHSNSVIEHVGDWERMVQFSSELERVADRYFVQTPNFWFPVEPHFITPFFQFLPEPIRVWMVLHFNLGHIPKMKSVSAAVRSVQGAHLVDRRMFGELFRDAQIIRERMLFLTKSFIAVKD